MSQRLPAVRLIACAVIETQRRHTATIHTPPARRNAELPCGRFGSTELRSPHADLIPQLQKPACPRLGQLSDVSQTSNLWSFARFLSADCSKMPRIRLLTTSLPGLKI